MAGKYRVRPEGGAHASRDIRGSDVGPTGGRGPGRQPWSRLPPRVRLPLQGAVPHWDNVKDPGPQGPEPAQSNPELAVGGGDARTAARPCERSELLAQGEVLDHEVGVGSSNRTQGAKQ